MGNGRHRWKLFRKIISLLIRFSEGKKLSEQSKDLLRLNELIDDQNQLTEAGEAIIQIQNEPMCPATDKDFLRKNFK